MRPNRYFSDQYELNTDPNLTAYANAGHVLYAHKATEGAHHYDEKHRARAKTAHEQGLTVLHYHYCRPDQNAVNAEMALFARQTELAWETGDLLALDFESAVKDKGAVVDMNYIEACWDACRSLSGHAARVYGSTSFLETFVRRGWLRRRGRWQAQYGPGPGRSPWGSAWWAWQMTDGQVGPEPHHLEGMPEGDISVLNLRTATVLSVRTARRRRRIKHQRR